MHLLATRHAWWLTECEATLQAEGIPGVWEEGEPEGVMLLEVPDAFADRVAILLGEQLTDELVRREAATDEASVPLMWRPAVASSVGAALLLLVLYAVMGGAHPPSLWFQRGAAVRELVLAGEGWRLITAATLHADAPHVLGNAGFWLVLGWAAAERLGSGAALLTWLFAATLGFAASLGSTEVVSTVGASGGLFGLLGAAASHALRHAPTRVKAPRRRLQVWSAAILFLAFTAFSPEANWYAHLAGFVAGFGVGAMAPARPVGLGWQALLAAVTAAAVVGAWGCAFARV